MQDIGKLKLYVSLLKHEEKQELKTWRKIKGYSMFDTVAPGIKGRIEAYAKVIERIERMEQKTRDQV